MASESLQSGQGGQEPAGKGQQMALGLGREVACLLRVNLSGPL